MLRPYMPHGANPGEPSGGDAVQNRRLNLRHRSSRVMDAFRVPGFVLCCTLALGLVAVAGCGGGEASPYEIEVLQERFEKDMAFSNPETTILRPAERERFAGLRYFPVDTAYRFVAPLIPADTVETVLVAHRTPPPVPYQRIGQVEIAFPEGTARLTVFRSLGEAPGRLWIPFTDATSGLETYGGGRYLDPQMADGRIYVDFNRAYNPYCDYNPGYNCAIPPPENRLSFPVRAGEKASGLLETAASGVE